MQNISRFFNLARAKLVPIVKVAGSAGGTTMVIRSRARTMIKCHASCIKVNKYYLVTDGLPTPNLMKLINDAMKPSAAISPITAM